MNTEGVGLDTVNAWLSNPETVNMLLAWGMKILGAVALLVAVKVLSSWAAAVVLKGLRRGNVDETLIRFGSNFAKWLILLIGGLAVLGIFGIQTASLIAILGAAGFAVGLAFQGSLSNFAAGVMLLVFRPFRHGQFVKVAGTAGTVDEIGLFTTSLDTPDKRRIIVPNSSIFGSTIENVSHHGERRVDVDLGTAYEADLEVVRATLLSVAKDIPHVLSEPAPTVVLTGLGASSIDWQIRAWVKAGDYWDVRDDLLGRAKRALDEKKIEIPYNKVDVNLLNGSVAPGLQPPAKGLLGKEAALSNPH